MTPKSMTRTNLTPKSLTLAVSFACGLLLATTSPVAAAEPLSPASGVVRATASTGVMVAYTLVVPKSVSRSNLQTRAVIAHGLPCPKVEVTDKRGETSRLPMTKRVPGATTVSAFASLRACQANLPKKLASAKVGGRKVPAALPATFNKIALFGDTGCRVDDDLHQDCASPTQWPLAKNSKMIAKERADVAIFTGDFYYREARCGDTKADPDPESPVNRPVIDKCGGTPEPVPGADFRDTDYGWMADVFIPMAPLLSSTPILPVRGNHEECFRAGNGWFLFFDSSPLGPAACAPATAYGKVPEGVVTPTWKFDMPISDRRTLRTVVVDSANGRNSEVTSWTPKQRPAYEKADQLSAPAKGQESWLLTHRPMFGVTSTAEDSGLTSWNNWTSIDQTAAAYGLIKNYTAMIASHIHVAQVVQIPGQPAQVVVGNGGSIPDSSDLSTYPLPKFGPLVGGDALPLPNTPAYAKPYPTASYLWTTIKYGYVVAQPGGKAQKWTLTQKDFTGDVYASCRMSGKQTTCKDA